MHSLDSDKEPPVIPMIISVDDHVLEPPELFRSRVPSRYREEAPHVERRRIADITFKGASNFDVAYSEDGTPGDIWVYEGDERVMKRHLAAAGFSPDEMGLQPITYDDMRPGCYEMKARLADMDLNHVGASLCFPTFPRFCGQTFLEAADKTLALYCVEAYNDWMVEEWCAGSGGRLIPLCLIPLWDPELAVREVRRNAARGVHAVAFSEIPAFLGLPSIHDANRHWDPFFAECAATDTTVCMHIGSSSRMAVTSEDAPAAVSQTLTFNNAMMSLSDFLFSGLFIRFPNLRIAYSEGQIGWLPYILERADDVWSQFRSWNGITDLLSEPPSSYYYDHVYGCFFRDQHGIDSLDIIGVDNVTFETDYPHTDSTWPNTEAIAQKMFAGLDTKTIYKITRGNAIRMLHLPEDVT